MADKPSGGRIAAIGGVVAVATGVVGLVGSSLGILDRFKGPEKAAAEERLDNVPETIDGYLSGPAMVTLWAQHTLCRDHDAATATCSATLDVVQRAERAVRTHEVWANPIDDGSGTAQAVIDDLTANDLVAVSYGHAEQTEYRITRTGVCATNAVLAQGARVAEPFAMTEAGEVYDLGTEGTEAFRAALAEEYANAAVGGDQCWRGRRSEDGRSLVWDTFLGDVIQPDQTTAYALLPKDADVEVRADPPVDAVTGAD